MIACAWLLQSKLTLQVRSALSGLEELDLSDLRYLSDLTFNRLTGCTPRLRRLSLAGCHIAFEFDPYRGCPVGAVEDSSALLSLRNLRRLLTELKLTLVALDLSRTSISPESLRSIAQVRILKIWGEATLFLYNLTLMPPCCRCRVWFWRNCVSMAVRS